VAVAQRIVFSIAMKEQSQNHQILQVGLFSGKNVRSNFPVKKHYLLFVKMTLLKIANPILFTKYQQMLLC